MGNTTSGRKRTNSTSATNKELQSQTHFSRKEISALRQEFEQMSKRNNGTGSITKDQFSQILQKHIKLWNGGSLFMERLFDAFDADGSKSIEVDEFIRGLSVFSKGTPEEKLELSFKIYDVNRDGHVTMNEINRVLTQLYSTFYPDDQTHQIKEITRRLFEDLDVDGDGELSLEEYKLSALKEPMIVNFLEQFMLESDL